MQSPLLSQITRFFRVTPVLKSLLLTLFLFFIVHQTADQYLGYHLSQTLSLSWGGVLHHGYYWQLFSYPLIHDDVSQLFFQLLLLLFIGGELESFWGSRRFLRFLGVVTVGSAVLFLLLQVALRQAQWESLVLVTSLQGISVLNYGLLAAYGLIFGERILLLMLLFPVKGKVFIWILVLMEVMTTFYSSGGLAATAGHLLGMLVGWLTLVVPAAWKVWRVGGGGGMSGRRTQSTRPRRWWEWGASSSPSSSKRPKHLRLVVSHRHPGEQDFEDDRAHPQDTDDPDVWH